MRVKHTNIRNDKLNTSEGNVEIDKDGFAEVDEKLGTHILSNPFGFEPVESQPAPSQESTTDHAEPSSPEPKHPKSRSR